MSTGNVLHVFEFFLMHRSYNPFVVKKDELSVVRDNDSRFLGNQMFWKYMDRIPPKHLYRPATVEYRSMKVIFLETVLVILLLIFFAIYVPVLHPSASQSASANNIQYWNISGNPLIPVQFFDWSRNDLVPGVFARSSSYSDVAGYLDFPSDWLFLNRSDSAAFSEEEGLFDVSEVSTGWDRRLIGGNPSINILLVGSVRLRQISVNRSDPTYCGLNLSPCFSVPISVSSTFNEDRFQSYPFSPSNISLEPTVAVAPDTFPGSGYIYDMALNKSDAVLDINSLQSIDWVDPSTRGVFVEVSYLNSRIDALITSIFVFVFDGSGAAVSESLGPVLEVAQPEKMSAQFSLLVLLFLTVSSFAFYILFIFLKQGPVDFFSSWWNAFDVVLVTLIFIAIGLILDPVVASTPSTLSPIYAVVPDLFIPQIALLGRSESIRTYLAVVSVLLAVRLVKCCTLFGGCRKMVKIFETCFYQLVSFLPVTLLGVSGIALGSFVVLNSLSGEWQTTSASFYSTVFAAARSLPRNLLELSPTAPIAIGAVLLYVGLVLVTWVVIPGVLFGLIASVIRGYEREINEAHALIEADKGALYPPGISRAGFWHKDVTRIFLYTWYHRIRGYELIQESEEEVGSPEEQSIDLELLPAFIQEKWSLTRARLIDMALSKGTTVSKSLTKLGKRKSSIGMYMSAASSMMAALKSGSTSMSGLFTVNVASMKDETRITRIQLQRLLDSDPSIVQTLLASEGLVDIGVKSIKALDLIRKYKSRDAVNRKIIMDHLIGEESSSVRVGSGGQRGLMKAIDDIDTFYRGEVFTISESCSDLSKDLLELKSALDGFKFKRGVARPPEISHRPIKPPR